MVAQFCETCGDKAPAAAIKVSSISTVKDHGSLSLAINGKAVDLAYTYVQTGAMTWSNVGVLVGCGADAIKNVPAEGRKQMFDRCRAGRDAVVQSSAAMGCKL